MPRKATKTAAAAAQKVVTSNRPKTERITIVGFCSKFRTVTNTKGQDYFYACQLNHGGNWYDVVFFGDARGWVEGEIFIPEANRYKGVKPLRNGSYVRLTGDWYQSEWTGDDGKNRINNHFKVSFPNQVEALERKEKRTSMVKFDDEDGAAAPPAAAPDAI